MDAPTNKVPVVGLPPLQGLRHSSCDSIRSFLIVGSKLQPHVLQQLSPSALLLLFLDAHARPSIHDAHDPSSGVEFAGRIGYDDHDRIVGGAVDRGDLRHGFDGVEHVYREAIFHTADESVSTIDLHGIISGQLREIFDVAIPSHQPVSGRFAEAHAKACVRHGSCQRFLEVFHAFDEVCHADDQAYATFVFQRHQFESEALVHLHVCLVFSVAIAARTRLGATDRFEMSAARAARIRDLPPTD
eukprot:CAMPEP_0183827148 /NCGR_PEP_ID=MMETSP0807_2-20130328/2089_1 /TAXON_ID=88271 /ORGANISM="Picocystis salinarum, Strain CCMP1897" /LENGTH=243 /DNA_ID=CAMNT_0026072297 /DNA_START=197 /DNA_END=926 /DNA_ORIENTATION=-